MIVNKVGGIRINIVKLGRLEIMKAKSLGRMMSRR